MKDFKRDWGYVVEYISKEGLYTVCTERIMPGNRIKKHYHKKTLEIGVVLEKHLLVNHSIAMPGDVFIWKPSEEHEYENPSSNEDVTILTITMPNYDPEDHHTVATDTT
ncbi:MAG: cupin domain-containing protein [Chloroflexota bacterium]